jgi:hypothetical protein
MASYGNLSSYHTQFSSLGAYNKLSSMGIPLKGYSTPTVPVPVHSSKGLNTLTYDDAQVRYPKSAVAYGTSCPQNFFFSNRCDLGYTSQRADNVSSS